MAGFKVLGFNHTSFTVSSLDQLIPFFVEGLGFKLMSRGPRDPKLLSRMTGIPDVDVEIAFLEGPGHVIELIEYRRAPERAIVRPRLCDGGAAHIGFDVDDIYAAVTMAARYGFHSPGELIAIDAGPNAGRRVVYVRNSDGLTFEFLEARRT